MTEGYENVRAGDLRVGDVVEMECWRGIFTFVWTPIERIDKSRSGATVYLHGHDGNAFASRTCRVGTLVKRRAA